MLNYVRRHTVPITIGVSFFVFGFFITANVLHLSGSEVLIGLVAGAACGFTMLVTSMHEEHHARVASTRPT